jgi:hypothetical protein
MIVNQRLGGKARAAPPADALEPFPFDGTIRTTRKCSRFNKLERFLFDQMIPSDQEML